MRAGLSNPLAGEFLLGCRWGRMGWKKEDALRPSVSVFSMGALEENYFGREILVKEYDKTKENTSVF